MGSAGERRKRARGRYFTAANLFDTPHFRAWAADAGLPRAVLLEPFAGGGDLLAMLSDLRLRGDFYACDLFPAAPGIVWRDSLADFPRGFSVVVTNPPWLARNSATRRGLPFPQTRFDDLYKHSVDLCLRNANYVAAIIPASFLSSGLFVVVCARSMSRAARFFATPKIRFVLRCLARNRTARLPFIKAAYLSTNYPNWSAICRCRLLAVRCVLTIPKAIWG